MIDFHSHVLPGVDDGPKTVDESLAMLRQSFLQGVDGVVSTSHFYGDQEYPGAFLKRRNQAFRCLQEAMLLSDQVYPSVILGAEVLYFPGISDAEEIEGLMIGSSKTILIEPPMAHWGEDMLGEIVELGKNLDCTPVIAHVDRYMQMLHDDTLIQRVREHNLLVQVNGSFFLNPKTVRQAIWHLQNGEIQLIGSDCHNLTSRAPNLGAVWQQVKAHHAEDAFKLLRHNAAQLLSRRRM